MIKLSGAMMFKKIYAALAIILISCMPTPVWAEQLVGSYVAFLSKADHFNSQGQRLTSAAAIIRQDRANFHRFKIRDPEDEDDPFFADAGNRTALEQMLSRGRANPSVISRIINGTPFIRVAIYRSSSGPFIRVTLIDKPQAEHSVNKAPPSQTKAIYSGTAFFVAPSMLLTNNHVLKDCTGSIQVRYPDQASHLAMLSGIDQTNDLALLRTDMTSSSIASFHLHARLGEPAATYGFPYADILSSSGNFTLGNVTSLSGIRDDTRFIQISTPIQPGNSGGPLLNMSGQVIGIVVSEINAIKMMAAGYGLPQNVNFAIQTPLVVNFLSTKGVTPKIAETTTPQPLPPSDIAKQAKQFTVQVYCEGISSKP